MEIVFEVTDRYIKPASADELLYTPLKGKKTTVKHSRRYVLEVEGSEKEAKAFVESTLVDDVSQELSTGEDAAVSGADFILDYGMKPGALDLEKEAILNYYKGLKKPGFTLKKLTIQQRLYLFDADKATSDRLVKDVCNAAVHQWTVKAA